MKRCCVCCLVLLQAFAAPLQADELGRLFLSPEQRAMLDRARDSKRQTETQPSVASEPFPLIEIEPEVEAAVPEAVRVDGYVQRSAGPQTIWLNGLDSYRGTSGELGIEGSKLQLESSRVRVPLGDGDDSVLLKPGQSFDPATAEVTDAYERRRALPGFDTDDGVHD